MKSQAGIDYSNGTANMDRKTGIHYGVIHLNNLNECAHELFDADYGDPACPHCRTAVVNFDPAQHDDYCEACQQVFDSDECFPEEPLLHLLNNGAYQAIMGEEGDIFVTKSPYFTYASYCSPCAPGACYLVEPIDKADNHPKAYCFGTEWFDSNKPPYAIYRVDTGECLYMPAQEESTP